MEGSFMHNGNFCLTNERTKKTQLPLKTTFLQSFFPSLYGILDNWEIADLQGCAGLIRVVEAGGAIVWRECTAVARMDAGGGCE